VFPLVYGELEHAGAGRMPRRITGESYVYRCTSGWVRVEPGSGKVREAYGYIHIDADGRHLGVYHAWGE
jgi:hypothetical protein